MAQIILRTKINNLTLTEFFISFFINIIERTIFMHENNFIVFAVNIINA